ncbi:MAG: ThiF family adenylyltransferase [Endozoicomonadaceae bacterium]|nr:ThiF family adenylyltransferase [Endozoicomonadaceae bacterium]MCY4329658.1 ThiF family adenylyltransferase [Endozoicomonadaceae bacterium]
MITDRYQRHSLIDWFSQEDVKASSFAVIGCGAIGNEVAKNLALLGVGKIDLFDFDTIEIHNLTRSVLFRADDIGFNKAEIAGKRIKELDCSIEVNVFPGDFWDLLSFTQISAYDAVLCCVDNFEARIKLNQLCFIAGTNLINTGIDSKFSQVEIFPFRSGKHIPCYECNLPDSVYARMQERYSCGWLKKIAFHEKKIPTTIITSALTGSLAVANALNLIKGEPQQTAKRILTNTFTGRSTVSTLKQKDNCPACSSMKDHIAIIKATARIENNFLLTADKENHIITSDPVLVSYHCTKCNPNGEDATTVFQKASDFDSALTICQGCKSDSVDINIKDSFSINELITNFSGKEIPAKFIRFDSKTKTTIIELEQN